MAVEGQHWSLLALGIPLKLLRFPALFHDATQHLSESSRNAPILVGKQYSASHRRNCSCFPDRTWWVIEIAGHAGSAQRSLALHVELFLNQRTASYRLDTLHYKHVYNMGTDVSVRSISRQFHAQNTFPSNKPVHFMPTLQSRRRSGRLPILREIPMSAVFRPQKSNITGQRRKLLAKRWHQRLPDRNAKGMLTPLPTKMPDLLAISVSTASPTS